MGMNVSVRSREGKRKGKRPYFIMINHNSLPGE
jgi:hypothetical protein